MFLKSLKLVGFKSFADRTRLELRPGVTVVVGPNGSGKSNIVDAIAWVMGSQSPKALRTGRMDDVIFAGTATRPGLGRAEVTLVLDNGSGALPLDLPEVSISRRLYRDGSSDYEINGVSCRLLDIQELLSDSGVGKHQHVIIGQGQIDSVLNATAEDHRAVVEEAAGILKHRLRKEKAIRHLERTDADVLRLRDLLGELTRQMRPLKRQAEAASRHDALAGEVRALRLWVGGEELRRLIARRAALAAERLEVSARLGEADAVSGEHEAILAILRADLRRTRHELDADTSAAAALETTVERLRRVVGVAHERGEALCARLEGADERRRDLESELADLTARLDAAGAAEDEYRPAVETTERRFRALEDEERSLADEETMPAEGAIAALRGELGSFAAAETRDTREAEAVARRMESLAGSLAESRAEVAAIVTEIAEIDGLVVSAQDRYAAAERERARRQEVWDAAEAAHGEARVEAAAARARLDAVTEAAEGIADPEARAVAESASGVLGSVTTRLAVPAELAAAVDAALGPWSDSVVFASSAALDGAVGLLKGAGRGGVPTVASTGRLDPRGTRTVAAEWGLDILVDLLGPEADQALAADLLGDVVVAEGWLTGRRLVTRHPEVRVVTPEGDLITAHGVRVAHPDGATPAMIEAASVAVEAAERELARAHSLLVQARRAFDDTRQAERDALEVLESLETRLAGKIEAQARLERASGAAEQETARLEERRSALVDAAAEREERRRRLGERLAALEGEEAVRQAAWEELAERRRDVAARREEARAEWQDLAAGARAAGERRRMVEARLAAVERLLAADAETTVDPTGIERLSRIEELGRQALAALADHVTVLRGRQASLRARVVATGGRIDVVEREHDEARREATERQARIGAIDVDDAEARVRLEASAEGLRRDADVTEEEALAAPRPEVAGGDPAGALASLEAEVRRLGPVNPLAAEEHAELAERHGFLSAQLDDLETSRDELRKVVAALDEEIESRFVAAFEEIARGYEAHFGLLFPGGTGRLRLTDSDHPLTSGVEIEAQPLGKKVSKMSLLSGGERSLAALAFLFAVFAARPSPFYILDEVEAALDDANLHRFLRLLERFRSNAQLLVITHQQQTMETADVLYGITMEPGGSSKAIATPLTSVSAADGAIRRA